MGSHFSIYLGMIIWLMNIWCSQNPFSLAEMNPWSCRSIRRPLGEDAAMASLEVCSYDEGSGAQMVGMGVLP